MPARTGITRAESSPTSILIVPRIYSCCSVNLTFTGFKKRRESFQLKEEFNLFNGLFWPRLIFPLFDRLQGGIDQQRTATDYTGTLDAAVRRNNRFDSDFSGQLELPRLSGVTRLNSYFDPSSHYLLASLLRKSGWLQRQRPEHEKAETQV